jgi:NitT/TauT family transport system substrate-binding protein
MKSKIISTILSGLLVMGGALSTSQALAKEKVAVAIIPISIYAPWYIVNEKGLSDSVEVDVKIIDDITVRNAALTSGDLQCMITTLDSTVVTVAAGIPVKHVAVPLMSYGLDQMVAAEHIKSDADIRGSSFAADYGFLNHMWMLLTMKRAGIPFNEASHKIMLPQDAAAAFVSGQLDIDVNFVPFSTQSLERKGSHLLKTSLTDKTWERGLISDSIACSSKWLKDNPETAQELIRAWFAAVEWWKENPKEGNEIVADYLKWPMADVLEMQNGAVMLNLNQNMGAIGLPGGKPMCASLPAGAPKPPAGASGWAKIVGGSKDCEAGYLNSTWKIFSDVYHEAKVTDFGIPAEEGIDNTILKALVAEGQDKKLSSNKWIGRAGL